MTKIKEIYDKLSQWFFAFWVEYRKVSLLFVFLIVSLWSLWLNSIPKESSPQIEFGIITINTVFPWVSPVDIDRLITQEIENAIDWIDWISKITSSSSVWFSNTAIELDNDADTTSVLNEIRSEVDKLRLPEDAQDPIINEIQANDQWIFELIIYGDQNIFPKEKLIEAWSFIKQQLEWSSVISNITIQWWERFDLEILVNKEQAEAIGIWLWQIAQAIRAHNANIPLGQFEVNWLNYDFRIQWELQNEQDLLAVPVLTNENTVVTVWDIATLIRRYRNDSPKLLWMYETFWNNAIGLRFSKRDNVSIFRAADTAKEEIEELMSRQALAWIQFTYASDLSEIIRDDYRSLARNWVTTIVFVLLCLFLFVGIKEAFIATTWIILAFFVTFTVLDLLWLTLNFLTNFSLVLTLWIAIDTSIVIVEAAYERMKRWYSPKTAVLLAVRDFKAPLIAWTMTTIVVFIPMMVLPWITGKFLAYIPITVFITLIAALFLSLTINPAMFYIFSKNKKYYTKSTKAEQFLTEDDKTLLEIERENKIAQSEATISRKQRWLEWLNNRYERKLTRTLESKKTRIWSICIPIILLLLTFFTLSPRIWFTLFPWWDSGRFDMTIRWEAWLTETEMSRWAWFIQPILSEYEELKHYIISINDNVMSISVELIDRQERRRNWLMDVFEMEKEVNERLMFLEQSWLTVESLALRWGPPQSKPVAMKLVTQDNTTFPLLIDTAREIQAYMRSNPALRNIALSSQDTPWQFVYEFRQDVLQTLWLTPWELQWEISAAVNWARAWSIKFLNTDADIRVLYEQFSDTLSPDQLLWVVLQTRIGPVRASDILTYDVENAVAQITREDTNITVTIDADLEESFSRQWRVIQNEITQRVSQQSLPDGISFVAWWETQENADLINATIRWFFIAFFLIFTILLLQFNSFRKPVVIMYAVFCALLWVNIGLAITGNPYSMPFAIGFIALTWIVVNDAIVFIDRVVVNRSHNIDDKEAIIEAWRSRLQPIILTTLTTLLWILPISLQDEFWSWLWFTIIFWLFAWSAMTLFIIPSLYYEIIVIEEVTRFKVLFWMVVLPPYWIYLLIKKIRGESRIEAAI